MGRDPGNTKGGLSIQRLLTGEAITTSKQEGEAKGAQGETQAWPTVLLEEI